jgi:hypothetical protein
VTVRSPHLYDALRSFCLGAFAALGPEVEQHGEIPFVVDERDGLYQYRPLLRDHVQARAYFLSQLEDARIAVDELRRERAAALFAGASGLDRSADRALFRTILLPLLVSTAEACGGFDWEDGAFNRVYGELEQSLFGTNRMYAAAAPVVGISIGATVELVRGMHVRSSSVTELSARRPEGRYQLPAGFGDDPERTCVLELERDLPADAMTLPDAPGELADAVTALRLATGAPVASGPVVFEQLDGRPFEVRPVLGIAATEPAGEPTRLDPWRGRLTADLLARLADSEQDAELGEAIERWELALFEAEPLRSGHLREALAALLGGPDGLWAAVMRATMLLGDTTDGRARLVEGMRRLARGDEAGPETVDAVRRTLVETILHDDRARLVEALDDALLGLRARPAGYFAARASAA